MFLQTSVSAEEADAVDVTSRCAALPAWVVLDADWLL